MITATLIGFIAGVCTLCSLLPQIAKVYSTKRAGDLSMGMLCLLFVGALLWGIYGALLKESPIMIFNSIYLVLISYQILLKRRCDMNDHKIITGQNADYYECSKCGRQFEFLVDALKRDCKK